MKTSCTIRAITGLSVAGLLFSGYLSAVKLFSDTCAVGGECPYFLGYPACYFGFLLYLALAILALFAILGDGGRKKLRRAMLATGILGVLFSGYFSWIELPKLLAKGYGAYAFGVPTCMIGLLFFALIALLAFMHMRALNNSASFAGGQ